MRGRPEDVLVDSDLDWGQDLGRLSARLKQLGVARIAFDQHPMLAWIYQVPECVPVDFGHPTETWTVIRPTQTRFLRWTPRWPGQDPWYEKRAPTERVGALLLYKTPP